MKERRDRGRMGLHWVSGREKERKGFFVRWLFIHFCTQVSFFFQYDSGLRNEVNGIVFILKIIIKQAMLLFLGSKCIVVFYEKNEKTKYHLPEQNIWGFSLAYTML